MVDGRLCTLLVHHHHIIKCNHSTPPVKFPRWFPLIIQCFHILHIFYHHQRDLEGNGIFKDPEIQTGALLQLIQTVNQRIAVNIQLPGCFRDVQVVLEELVDGRKRLFIDLFAKISFRNILHSGIGS